MDRTGLVDRPYRSGWFSGMTTAVLTGRLRVQSPADGKLHLGSDQKQSNDTDWALKWVAAGRRCEASVQKGTPRSLKSCKLLLAGIWELRIVSGTLWVERTYPVNLPEEA